MNAPVGPGDLLERIKPSAWWDGFVVGNIYQVREVVSGDSGLGCLVCDATFGVLLCDAPDPEQLGLDPGGSWCLCAFRPVSRRGDFEAFLNAVRAPCDVAPFRVPEPVSA